MAGPAGRIRNPAWAPDGSWLVVESDAASYRDLFRVERAGGEARRLTDAPYGSFEPSVSPDGARIAFGTSRDGNAEIWAMRADGSGARRLTTIPGTMCARAGLLVATPWRGSPIVRACPGYG